LKLFFIHSCVPILAVIFKQPACQFPNQPRAYDTPETFHVIVGFNAISVKLVSVAICDAGYIEWLLTVIVCFYVDVVVNTQAGILNLETTLEEPVSHIGK